MSWRVIDFFFSTTWPKRPNISYTETKNKRDNKDRMSNGKKNTIMRVKYINNACLLSVKLINTPKQHRQPPKVFIFSVCVSISLLLSRFHTSFRLGHTVYSHSNGKPVKCCYISTTDTETGECKTPKRCHYWSSPNFLIMSPAEDYKWLHVGGLFYYVT